MLAPLLNSHTCYSPMRADRERAEARERAKWTEERERVYGSRLFLLEPVLLSGYSSRQRYRVLTRLRNLACHKGKRGTEI